MYWKVLQYLRYNFSLVWKHVIGSPNRHEHDGMATDFLQTGQSVTESNQECFQATVFDLLTRSGGWKVNNISGFSVFFWKTGIDSLTHGIICLLKKRFLSSDVYKQSSLLRPLRHFSQPHLYRSWCTVINVYTLQKKKRGGGRHGNLVWNLAENPRFCFFFKPSI